MINNYYKYLFSATTTATTMATNMTMVTTDSPEMRMRYLFAFDSVFLELYTVVRSAPI